MCLCLVYDGTRHLWCKNKQINMSQSRIQFNSNSCLREYLHYPPPNNALVPHTFHRVCQLPAYKLWKLTLVKYPTRVILAWSQRNYILCLHCKIQLTPLVNKFEECNYIIRTKHYLHSLYLLSTWFITDKA